MATNDPLFEASRAANEVVLNLNLKRRIADGYTRIDPSIVASQAGVPVLYRYLDRLLGGFIRDGGTSGILINSDRPRGLIHMTCAHELGHYFLGHESTTDETVEIGSSAAFIEQMANQFAYSLLAPRWLIATVMRAHGWTQADLQNPHILYQLSLRLGTSFTAMVWSLSRLGLIGGQAAAQIVATQPKSLKAHALMGATLVHPKADVWVLGPADRDRILEPGYGDQFVVELPNHAGSGHLWSADELRSEGFVLKPFTVDARAQLPVHPNELRVGGHGATLSYLLQPPERFQHPPVTESELEPIDERRQHVALHEVAPWAPVETAIGSISFSTEFEPTREGLTVAERQRRIERTQHQ